MLSLVVDVPIRAGWMFEALVQRLDGSLGLTATPEIGRVPLSSESFELITAQVGLQRTWGAGSWQPFVAAGVGVGRVESSARLLSRPIVPGASGERFAGQEVPAASVAGGAKMSLGRRLGLRLEARGHWIDLPRELGGERFQGEVSVGLTGRL